MRLYPSKDHPIEEDAFKLTLEEAMLPIRLRTIIGSSASTLGDLIKFSGRQLRYLSVGEKTLRRTREVLLFYLLTLRGDEIIKYSGFSRVADWRHVRVSSHEFCRVDESGDCVYHQRDRRPRSQRLYLCPYTVRDTRFAQGRYFPHHDHPEIYKYKIKIDNAHPGLMEAIGKKTNAELSKWYGLTVAKMKRIRHVYENSVDQFGNP